MTERQLLTKFSKDIKAFFGPELFWYKIPDIPMSSVKKPFDVFAVYKGRPYCLEFKTEEGKIQPHQAEGLKEAVIAGAKCAVITFFTAGTSQRSISVNGHLFFYKKGYAFSNFFEVVDNG